MGHLLPTVLVIGAQKAGTTSLHTDLVTNVVGLTSGHSLASEPSWGGQRDKEIHYFDMNFREGLAYYVKHFQPCPAHLTKPGLLAIDATPNYMRAPGIAQRARAAFMLTGAVRAVRIIAVLRSPTERARSWYDHMGRQVHGVTTAINTWALQALDHMSACAERHGLQIESSRLWGSACHMLGREYQDVLTGGMYAPQLSAWIRAFGASQIIVSTFGGYLDHAGRVLADLARFVGSELHAHRASMAPRKPPVPRPKERRGRAGPRRRAHAPRAVADLAQNSSVALRAPPGARRALLEAAHLNAHKRSASVLGDAERAALDNFFTPHVNELIMLLRAPSSRGLASTPFSPASSLTPWMLMAK